MSSFLPGKAGGGLRTKHIDDGQVLPDGRSTERPPSQKYHKNGSQPVRKPLTDKDNIGPRLFSCPFYMFDPVKSRTCTSFVFQRSAEAFQHISQRHALENHCGTCYEEFTSESRRDAHIWAGSCTYGERPPGSRLSRRELSDLEQSHGQSPVDWWYSLWDTISRGQPRPDSPYVTGGSRDGIGVDRGAMSPEDAIKTRRDEFSNDIVQQLSAAKRTQIVMPSDSGYASSKTDTHPYANVSLEDTTQTSTLLVKDQWEEEHDDKRTVYSMVDDVVEAELDAYKSEISQAILRSIRHLNCQPSQIDHIASVLPTLLRSFALRLGVQGSTQAAKDAMYFVHKYRGDITTRLQNAAKNSHDDNDRDQSSSEPFSKQNIEKWRQEVQQFSTLVPTEALGEEPRVEDGGSALSQESAVDFEEPPPLPDKPGYREAVFKSASFRWLLESLAKSVMLSFEGENFCATLQSMVMKCLERQQSVSNKRASECYTMTFHVNWNPTAFLQEQFTNDADIGRLLGEVLTLTGSTTNAQILPCAEYLSQTWPSTGSALLELLKTAVVTGTSVSGLLEDGTQLEILFAALRLEVKVDGTAASIAEVGEQIAWLGAALRSSCVESGIATCTPQIRIDDTDGQKSCHISFRMKPYRGTGVGLLNGQCWHELCQNPVLVEGYPIAARSRQASGLEIPLDILSGITQCPRISHFLDRYYLKGFSTAVMAVANLGHEMLWHLYYTSDGSRLPYPAAEPDNTAGNLPIDIDALTKARHIVGWCSEAMLHAGAQGMNYEIKGSRLQSPSKDFALEKLSLSFSGGFVSAGMQFAIGRKDAHVRLSRGSYRDKLAWIDQRYFTLWDVGEKRGWLVNGIAALTHLLRSSLRHYKLDRFSQLFLLDENDLQESPNPLTFKSTLDFLFNNQDLVLFQGDERTVRKTVSGAAGEPPKEVIETTSSPTTLKDRVEQLYETIEKLADHYATTDAAYKGLDVKVRARHQLEGWDFVDVATDRDPLFLKKTVLPFPLFSTTWVDFTRSIPAITLFGQGFGDMIRASPASASRSCEDWKTVPKGRNLLCVSCKDLDTIAVRTGDPSATPLILGQNIIWPNTCENGTFHSSCPCIRRTTAKRTHHSIQEVQSSKWGFKPSNSTLGLEKNLGGAVIFGEKHGWLSPYGVLPDSPSQNSTVGHSSTSVPSDSGDASSKVLADTWTNATGQHSDDNSAELAALMLLQPGNEQNNPTNSKGKRKASPLRGEPDTRRTSRLRRRMVDTWERARHGADL